MHSILASCQSLILIQFIPTISKDHNPQPSHNDQPRHRPHRTRFTTWRIHCRHAHWRSDYRLRGLGHMASSSGPRIWDVLRTNHAEHVLLLRSRRAGRCRKGGGDDGRRTRVEERESCCLSRCDWTGGRWAFEKEQGCGFVMGILRAGCALKWSICKDQDRDHLRTKSD